MQLKFRSNCEHQNFSYNIKELDQFNQLKARKASGGKTSSCTNI